ncbi:hypothetical protein BH10BAC5_BH10BAC5_25510 [soil metagenome]
MMVGQTINSYKILNQIAEGGMGIIYLARHNYLDRKAAIKILNTKYSNNTDIRERFLHEAKTLSVLDHPYIVKILDFGQHGEIYYIIMEFVEGITLEDHVTVKNGLIPEDKAKELFIKILSGLGYSHSKDVVHRDIKPSNIIIDTELNPKILDFGIARLLTTDNRLTRVGGRMGSPLFMSPEQCLGKETDQQSDIYSVGVTLYETITAKHPFENDGDSDYTLQSRILNEDPLPPSYHYPLISKHMEYIISTAMSKDPYNRFSSCFEFIEALNNPYFTGSYNFKPVEYETREPYVYPDEKDYTPEKEFNNENPENDFPEESNKENLNNISNEEKRSPAISRDHNKTKISETVTSITEKYKPVIKKPEPKPEPLLEPVKFYRTKQFYIISSLMSIIFVVIIILANKNDGNVIKSETFKTDTLKNKIITPDTLRKIENTVPDISEKKDVPEKIRKPIPKRRPENSDNSSNSNTNRTDDPPPKKRKTIIE